MKAVIPAAGKGTRHYPWTLHNPKELLPIPDPTNPQKIVAVADLVVREAYEAGCKDILMITARGKYAIKEHLEEQQLAGVLPDDIDIYYIEQHGAKGLGHAVGRTKTHIGLEDFAVLLGDDFYENNPTKELIAAYNQKKFDGKFGAILTVQQVPVEELKRYGVVKITKPGKVMDIEDIIEKPLSNPPSNYAVTGRYIFSNKIFPYIEKTKPDANNEIQLTDAIRPMICDGYKVYALEISGKRYDTGEPNGWVQTIIDLKNNKNKKQIQ